MRMKQEQPGPFSDDPGKQERFDKEFLEKAKRRAQAVAEKNFNLRSKNIELGAYSKDELLFIFDMMQWEKLEPMLNNKFEFISDGDNIVFTKIKEEQKKELKINSSSAFWN